MPFGADGHHCKSIHGYTYHLTVFLEGGLSEKLGWVVDYTDLKNIVKPILEIVDHQLLNHIDGLENPTSKLICIWLWDKIKPNLSILKRIELKETPTSGAIYEG